MLELWSPSEDFVKQSNMFAFQQYIEKKYAISFANYHELQQWSTDNIAQFWECIVTYFDIEFGDGYHSMLSHQGDRMIDYRWFEGATISYAEHVFRNRNNHIPAIIFGNESGAYMEISWDELERQVVSIRRYLSENGVGKGDRVAAFLPNTPEAVVAFLAANSLGAIWSCCSPDFGVDSVVDRLLQIQPKAFIATTDYVYNGKNFDKRSDVDDIMSRISSIEVSIRIDYTNKGDSTWHNILVQYTDEIRLQFEKVDFSHPIWILYSSGTTGIPKAITHGTGGNLLEHLKALSLHQNVKAGDRFLWFSTTGWMMWNYALSSLLVGATLVIYDGSPGFPVLDTLWGFVDRIGVTHFGIGAAYYLACMKENLNITSRFRLENLMSLGSTGSPLPMEGFRYIYDKIKGDVWLVSLSGGTDVCSAFVGGSPYLSVYEGEIQCRMLGAAIEAWNDRGEPISNEVGELMIVKPMPSMPVYFWNDEDSSKYLNAYFEHNTSIWKHGDFIKITLNKGIIIYGRSDATLNKDGVRIGTAEIYSAVEGVAEVKDSIIICIEKGNGTYFMPLFVKLKDDQSLNDNIIGKIKNSIRKQYSPRHVPDSIIQVKDIPYTTSGKKMETPLKKIFLGYPTSKCYSTDAMRNPECMEEYIQIHKDSI
jgi:acetoacetyl-CoA synthetase